MPMDSATWARARGWALWKAMITLVPILYTDPVKAAEQHRIIEAVLTEHERAA
jgi:aminoglycoside phosphotransferase (APT) family kinase protein